MYSASKLPSHLIAPPIDNPQTVDLSRLSINQTGTQQIDSGDVLELTIAAGLGADDTTTLPVRVNDQGYVDIPVVGRISLAGLEPEAAEATIASACIQKGLYRSPHVTISMKRQRVNRVTVIGAVKVQGVYEIPRRSSDLVAALVAAGGLAEDAGTDIEIRNPLGAAKTAQENSRIAAKPANGVVPANHTNLDPNVISGNWSQQKPQIMHVNLAKASEDSTGGYRLGDGSIVRVEKRDPMPIHVMGLVAKPNRYDYPVAEEMRLLDAIALAGGMSSPVADKVFVIRKTGRDKEPAVIVSSLRKAKRSKLDNVRLTPGDIVSIEKTPATILFGALQFLSIGAGASIPLF